MLVTIIAVIVALAIAVPLSVFLTNSRRNDADRKKVQSAGDEARAIIDKAISDAENKKREALLEAKEENLKARNDLEKEIRDRRAEVSRNERRLQQKEEALDKKSDGLERKEQSLSSREDSLRKKQEEIAKLGEQRTQELERISGLTTEQAKEYLLKLVEEDVKHDSAVMIKEAEAQAKEEADKKAKEYVVSAIQRCATGVDLIIDDTPEAVVISGFDPIRREVARIALERLIVDGRIHPARIEEMVEKAKKEVEATIKEEGEAATLEVGVHGIHPELVRLLGKMRFRTSYGQNALKHSIEVAQLSGLLAGELGLDVRMAKRAGLLHDIGKAVDHEMEGSHVQLGAELCRKYKESPIVINAVESHHGDTDPTSLIACIVQAADTISAARPGARRETLETYTTRLKQLEEITNSFKGVSNSYAIQAGREVRVMVVPEKISDTDMVLLAHDISKKIEDEMEYPGQIKVNVIRESRVTDYAK